MVFLRLSIAILMTLIALATSAVAGMYAVGACQPNLPVYSRIQEAVTNVPAGSTILVCPGNYPEQVVISKPLSLRGVPNMGESVVSVPHGGLVKSIMPRNLFRTYYQILVRGTSGPVDISDLAVEGTTANPKPVIVAGIMYLNSSGTISHVSARNQTGFGVGILALTSEPDSQTVNILDNVVRGVTGEGSIGIVAYGADGQLTANIKGNIVHDLNSPQGFLSGNGIQAWQATGNIESNIISEIAMGIELFNSSITVRANTISTGLISIEVDSGSNTITGNKIDAGGATGFSLGGVGTNTIVRGNTIGNAAVGIFGCDGPGGFSAGFTITGNSVTDAIIGMQMPSPNGNVTTPNSYYATATAVSPQSCF